LPEALVRTLRHEMGDFLQKVYASVAILKTRLPHDSEMEHGLLDRLRARAETCKDVLDAAHDFICPVILDCEPVDLAELTETITAKLRPRFPAMEIRCETTGPTRVAADPRRAAQVLEALLTNACEAAKTQVVCHIGPEAEHADVQWSVLDDGPGFPAEEAERLFSPFFTTKAGHAGLGLALARKLMDLHGGRVFAAAEPGGGFRAGAVFPVPSEPALPAAAPGAFP
jgi:signal transduction histidine kinase